MSVLPMECRENMDMFLVVSLQTGKCNTEKSIKGLRICWASLTHRITKCDQSIGEAEILLSATCFTPISGASAVLKELTSCRIWRNPPCGMDPQFLTVNLAQLSPSAESLLTHLKYEYGKPAMLLSLSGPLHQKGRPTSMNWRLKVAQKGVKLW